MRKPSKRYQIAARVNADLKSWVNHAASQLSLSESNLLILALHHFRTNHPITPEVLRQIKNEDRLP